MADGSDFEGQLGDRTHTLGPGFIMRPAIGVDPEKSKYVLSRKRADGTEEFHAVSISSLAGKTVGTLNGWWARAFKLHMSTWIPIAVAMFLAFLANVRSNATMSANFVDLKHEFSELRQYVMSNSRIGTK